jgi:hypothetical protein
MLGNKRPVSPLCSRSRSTALLCRWAATMRIATRCAACVPLRHAWQHSPSSPSGDKPGFSPAWPRAYSWPARTCLPLGVMIAFGVSRTMKRSPSPSSDFAIWTSSALSRVGWPSAANLSKSFRSPALNRTIWEYPNIETNRWPKTNASPACCVCYSFPSYLKDTLILVR